MYSSKPSLEIIGVSAKVRGRRLLHDVTLTAHIGRIHALLGRNGAGKSTTFKAALGLISIDSGTIRILGEPLTAQALRHVGASINGPALYGHLSAHNNLQVHQLALGLPKTEIKKVLKIVGLEHVGNKKTKTFSTGMKARLALAIALLGSPEILILDEPQNGLDPQGTSDLRRLLCEYVALGKTVIISSHQLSEISKIADDITVIDDGHTVFSGSTEEFKRGKDFETSFFELTGKVS